MCLIFCLELSLCVESSLVPSRLCLTSFHICYGGFLRVVFGTAIGDRVRDRRHQSHAAHFPPDKVRSTMAVSYLLLRLFNYLMDSLIFFYR